MNAVRCLALAGCAWGILLSTLPVAAQDASRDPTVAPSETGTAAPSPAGGEGMTVLVRDGRPYLVVGTRQYAPGDKIGNLRLQRVTEKEVWFHDGNALIKVPRFAGIQRNISHAKSPCTAAANSAASAVAPCKDTQP